MRLHSTPPLAAGGFGAFAVTLAAEADFGQLLAADSQILAVDCS